MSMGKLSVPAGAQGESIWLFIHLRDFIERER